MTAILSTCCFQYPISSWLLINILSRIQGIDLNCTRSFIAPLRDEIVLPYRLIHIQSMNCRFVLSGFLLSLLFFQLSIAQENDVLFTKIVGNNGETLFKITAITQDPKGYMWFSGQNSNSLYRYDGY